MADGGEGTVAAFLAGGARAEDTLVRGPLGSPTRARFALADGGLAVIEMAAASGLLLFTDAERDPLRASTYGTGEVVRQALDLGAENIVLGIGGSATNDGGAGLLAALGVRFLDAGGRELAPGGAALARLATVDVSGLDPRLRNVRLQVASDVDSVLCGTHGASVMFGAQKGASAQDIDVLDAALTHYANVTEAVCGRDCRIMPGAGAAGGLGFGLLAYLDAELRPGIEIIAEVKGLRGVLGGADLCLTGEGRIDKQTLRCKTVAGVARCAREAGVPVIAFAGSIDATVEPGLAECGVGCAMPIVEQPMTLESAFVNAGPLLERAAARVGRLLAFLV